MKMKRGPLVLMVFFCLWMSASPLVWADEEEEQSTAPTTPATTTTRPTDPKEILARIAQFRGLPVKSDVPIKYTSRTQMVSATTDPAMLDKARQALADTEAYLRLLDTLPDDSDLVSAYGQVLGEQIGGTYNFTEHQMMVVGTENDLSALDESTLVHEYVHALQDQNLDAGSKLSRLDKENGYVGGLTALLEGDATFTTISYIQSTAGDAGLKQVVDQSNQSSTEQFDKAPPILQASLIFPYVQGARFVAALYQNGGWDAINKAYANPPRSSEQVIHPDRYLAGDDPKSVTLPDITKTLGGSWTVAESGVMGEFDLLFFLAPGIGSRDAAVAAEGWGGDQFLLLKNSSTGKYALAALTRWDSEQDAIEFELGAADTIDSRDETNPTVAATDRAVWTAPGRAWYLSRRGSDVLLVIGPDEGSLSSIVRRIPGWPR